MLMRFQTSATVLVMVGIAGTARHRAKSVGHGRGGHVREFAAVAVKSPAASGCIHCCAVCCCHQPVQPHHLPATAASMNPPKRQRLLCCAAKDGKAQNSQLKSQNGKAEKGQDAKGMPTTGRNGQMAGNGTAVGSEQEQWEDWEDRTPDDWESSSPLDGRPLPSGLDAPQLRAANAR